ncbi:MAG: serine--tRNA ligase [Pseudomonadota bacterium]
MLDNKLLRDDPQAVADRLARKGYAFPVTEFSTLEGERRKVQERTEQLRSERNRLSKAIGQAKGRGEDAANEMAAVEQVNTELDALTGQFQSVQERLDALLAQVPNLPDDSVPEGLSEDDNRLEKIWGGAQGLNEPAPDHVELGAHGGLDFEVATKVTGSRFVVLRGAVARLQRALTQFMLDVHTTAHGYQEVYVPYIVNGDSLFGTGQLPKMGEDLFKLEGEQGYYLAPTAEVPVTNMLRGEIVAEAELPLKYVCHTPCFRSEAGSYGRDTRGMIRQHQFEKVELVQAVHPDRSWDALEELTGHAEAILERLELPYRRMTLCGGDLSFASAKTYDLEVWLPGQNTYREISSCSNFLDFQARRMQARFRRSEGKAKPELIHTLNGSALAVGRTLVAVLENYQREDGSVAIPEALQPYTGGLTEIPAATA